MAKYVRKIMKISSHSYSIVLPKELVKKFGWHEKKKVSIEEKDRKTLLIKDWKKQ